jgi:hypothetical protein
MPRRHKNEPDSPKPRKDKEQEDAGRRKRTWRHRSAGEAIRRKIIADIRRRQSPPGSR